MWFQLSLRFATRVKAWCTDVTLWPDDARVETQELGDNNES